MSKSFKLTMLTILVVAIGFVIALLSGYLPTYVSENPNDPAKDLCQSINGCGPTYTRKSGLPLAYFDSSVWWSPTEYLRMYGLDENINKAKFVVDWLFWSGLLGAGALAVSKRKRQHAHHRD